eukprot:s758_g8.t1
MRYVHRAASTASIPALQRMTMMTIWGFYVVLPGYRLDTGSALDLVQLSLLLLHGSVPMQRSLLWGAKGRQRWAEGDTCHQS